MAQIHSSVSLSLLWFTYIFDHKYRIKIWIMIHTCSFYGKIGHLSCPFIVIEESSSWLISLPTPNTILSDFSTYLDVSLSSSWETLAS